MKVHEIMTAHARCVGPDNTLVEAAGLMRELDVGALPVCEDDRIAGIVTDRDIVLRSTADGRDPNSTAVRDVMSPGVVHVTADQEVDEAARVMEERQVRRLPVLGRDRRLVGIVSLGDIALSSNPAFSGLALRDVSEPAKPTQRQRRLTQQSTPTRMTMETEEAKRRRPSRKTRRAASGGKKNSRGRAGKARKGARRTMSVRSRR